MAPKCDNKPKIMANSSIIFQFLSAEIRKNHVSQRRGCGTELTVCRERSTCWSLML